VCLEKLYQSALEKRQEAAAQFAAADAEFQSLKREYCQLSDELRSLKKLSPQAAPILSEFTPFEDISPPDTTPLPVCTFLW